MSDGLTDIEYAALLGGVSVAEMTAVVERVLRAYAEAETPLPLYSVVAPPRPYRFTRVVHTTRPGI